MVKSTEKRRVVQSYKRLVEPNTEENPYARFADAAAAIRQRAETPTPTAMQAGLRGAFSPHGGDAPPSREDQVLGYNAGFYGAWDNAAILAEALAERAGIPVEAINRFAGMPSAAEVADRHQRALEEAALAGIRPGGAGMLVGKSVANASLLPLSPVTGLIAGQVLGADRTEPDGQAVEAFIAGRRRRSGR